MEASTEAANQSKDEDMFFEPPFLKKLSLKGFLIRNMELESRFMKELRESLKIEKWRDNERLIAANCESDPKIHGMVMNGRHRLYAVYANYREDEVPIPTIPIDWVPVENEVQFKLKMAGYEAEHLLRKSPAVARQHIETIITELRKEHPEVFAQRTLEQVFLEHGDKEDVFRIRSVLEDIQRLADKARVAKEKKMDDRGSKPAGNNKLVEWNTESRTGGATSQDQKDGAGQDGAKKNTGVPTLFTGEIKSITCTHCHKPMNDILVNITVPADGSTAKVEPLN